ncbi:hypothetical protein HMPREF9072_00901 [Capnocytophaga sp. oral taxon 324 str. F0483]|nr:hypothetical protein HMPREF9072_00901 [Capnocytophaga sp. oral taxon 324 str. F0483]
MLLYKARKIGGGRKAKKIRKICKNYRLLSKNLFKIPPYTFVTIFLVNMNMKKIIIFAMVLLTVTMSAQVKQQNTIIQ